MYATSDLEILKSAPPIPRSCAPKSLLYEHRGPQDVEGTLRILPPHGNRSFQQAHDLLPNQPLILFGMSPGNGYFTRKRIEIAICGMAHLFGDVVLVSPDTIAVHTYRARGYSEDECRARVRANGLKIKDRCHRAIERVRVDSPSANIRLLDWERDIASSSDYSTAFAEVCQLFESNERFRNDILAKGSEVLSAKLGGQTPTWAALRESVNYLLKEFAYFTICRSAFGRDLVIPYYQNFTLGQDFCEGLYANPSPRVPWLMYEVEIFDAIPSEGGLNVD